MQGALLDEGGMVVWEGLKRYRKLEAEKPMIFTPTPLEGAFLIDPEFRSDHRGGFARTFCSAEFEKHGLNPLVVQTNMSFNPRKGTLRGLHYQTPPASEAKYVRCTKGAVFVTIIDLRAGSKTHLRHFGVELNARERRAIYVPEMFAHGYLTLLDETEVSYNTSAPYTPELERGIRYDDPLFDIRWPIAVESISDKDLSWPPFKKP
jgi:dTDP-4-dehydrorhamnose 3,5-epimerase